MAWTRSHVGADGRRHWYVTWKNPKAGRKGEPAHLSRALGPVTEAEARAEAVVIAEAEEGHPAPREGVTAADALRRFLAHAKTVRGWREKTCTFYEQKLEPCLTYLSARAPMRQWHPGMLADYLASRARRAGVRGLAPATLRSIATACGTFVRWATRARLEVPDFAAGLDLPVVRKVERKAFALGEVRALQAAVDAGEATPWLRLAVWLASEAGLSLGDLRIVRWEDIDRRDGVLRMARSKTGRPLAIPLSAPLAAALKRSRATHGLILRDMPEDDGTVNQGWRRLCRRVGIEAAGGLKRLRHTWLTELGRRGVDPATMRELAGHAPGSSQIMVYLHTDLDRKREAVGRLSRPSGDRAG